MSNALQPATEQQQNLLAVATSKVADGSAEWQQILREAEKLAAASLTPVHLKVSRSSLAHVPEADRGRVAWQQTVANCILVANQAHRWHADVFAVAAETYVVGNKLGYQGKLIAGIVNTRGGLTQPLAVLYSTGKGDDLAAVVYGKRDGDIPKEAFPLLEAYADHEDRGALRKLAPLGVLAIRISVGQSKTKNEMWHKDPEQKLWYSGATKWARRHAPELMQGILSNDDLDRMRESELHIGHEAAQSRIGMVIPASLDASGVLPADGGQGVERQSEDPPDDDESQQEEPEQSEPESQETDDSSHDADETLALIELAEAIMNADKLLALRSLRERAAADKRIKSESGKSQIKEAFDRKEAEIKGGRGPRTNGK